MAAPRICFIPFENQGYPILTSANWATLKALILPGGATPGYTSHAGFFDTLSGTEQPSGPNYQAVTFGTQAGDAQFFADDSFHDITLPSIFDRLLAAGIKWGAYAESLTAGGAIRANGAGYLQRHFEISYCHPYNQSNSYFDPTTGSGVHDAGSAGTAFGTSGSNSNFGSSNTFAAMLADMNSGSPASFYLAGPCYANQGHGGATGGVWSPSSSGNKVDASNFAAHIINAIKATSWYAAGGNIILWWDESLHSGGATGEETNLIIVNEGNAKVNGGQLFGNASTLQLSHIGLLHDILSAYGVADLGHSTHQAGSISTLLSGTTVSAATKVAFTVQPSTAVTGTVIPTFKVAVEDASSNVVAGSTATVTLTIGTNPGGTLSGTTSVAAVAGVATFSNVIITGTAGTYTLVASSAPLTAATSGNFSINASVGAATQLLMGTQPTGALSGSTIGATTVKICDATGATVTTDNTTTVTAALSANPGGTLTGTLTKTAVNGIATFSNLVVTGVAGNYSLAFTSSPVLTGVTSSTFAITTSGGGGGTQTKLQSAGQQETAQSTTQVVNASSTTPLAATTVGSLVIVVVGFRTSTTGQTVTVTDSGGNTYRRDVIYNALSAAGIAIFSSVHTASATSITATCNATATMETVVEEWSGYTQTLDGTNTAPKVTDTAPTSGIVTLPTGAIDLVIGAFVWNGTGADSALTGGFTAELHYISNVPSLVANLQVGYVQATPAGGSGGYALSGTIPSAAHAGAIAAYKAGPGASAPSVSSLSPSTGPAAGGTAVTITGTNLTGATSVKFGTVSAAFTVVNATTITTTSPAGSAGTVDVTVVGPGGTSSTSSGDQFIYTSAFLSVTSISPNSGPPAGGTAVTVTGTGFTGATAVNFGATPATSLVVVSATRITCVSPAGSAGAVDVTVVTPGGTSLTGSSDLFTYLAAGPNVTSVVPNHGGTGGGTAVTINGTGFTGTTAVKFGTAVATSVVVVSDVKITCVSPAVAAGAVDVRVTVGGASGTRSALQQPFLSTSIWNQPIGASAVYTAANVAPATIRDMTTDQTVFLMQPGATPTPIKLFSGAGVTGSCTADNPANPPLGTVPMVPESTFLNPPASHNYAYAAVLADGHTHDEGSSFTRCAGVGYATAGSLKTPAGGLTGDGLVGARGASLLAVAGGAIRVGEFVPGGVIPHALAINVDAHTNLLSSSVGQAFRWPATKADSYASDPARYGGTNPKFTMGVMLALPPGFNVAGLLSPAGRILGACFQNYGSIVVNDSARSVNAITVEIGGAGNMETHFASDWAGHASDFPGGVAAFSTPGQGGTDNWSKDVRAIYAALMIVDNNNLTNYTAAVNNYATGVPANYTGAGGGAPVVTYSPNIGGSGSSTTSPITAADVYTFTTATPPPAISGVAPTSVVVGNVQVVTITGSAFTAASAVHLGATNIGTFTVTDDAHISATVPNTVAAGTYDFTVTTAAGTSAVLPADQFTVLPPIPAVTSISPTTGPRTGGTPVTVTGTSFTGATAVFFAAIPATNVVVVSSTSITCVSPTFPVSPVTAVDVTVVTPSGTSPTSGADLFTFTAAPFVSGLAPASVPVGTAQLVTISGGSFTGVTAVRIGGASIAFTFVNDTTVTATVPGTVLSGIYDITVTTPSGTSPVSGFDQFSVLPPLPTVTAISPSTGLQTGGAVVTITGTGWSAATLLGVSFGTVPATAFAFVNATTVTATAPPGVGVVDVSVTTIGGQSGPTSADLFTYSAPTVLSLPTTVVVEVSPQTLVTIEISLVK